MHKEKRFVAALKLNGAIIGSVVLLCLNPATAVDKRSNHDPKVLSPKETQTLGRSLGLMAISFDNIGSRMTSSAYLVPSGGRKPGASTDALTELANGIDLAPLSYGNSDDPIGGQRYLYANYKVRNAQYCPTTGSCTPYTTPTHNLTLVPASTTYTLAGTGVLRMILPSGSSAAPALALQVAPLDPALANSNGSVEIIAGYRSFEAYTETEVSRQSFSYDPSVISLFPFGFVTKNSNTTTTRALPANPAVNQYDGQVSVAARVPLQSTTAADPTSITFLFDILDDTVTRVSEAIDDQTYTGDGAAVTTASNLSATKLVVLGTHAEQINSTLTAPICSVRTGGTSSVPTAYLTNVTTPTVAATPYNLPIGAAPSSAINAAYCISMNAPTASSFVVTGSQSGPRPAAGATYSGGGTQIMAFTPFRPFFDGETVSYSLTSGLSSSIGNTPAVPFVGTFPIGGLTSSTGSFADGSNLLTLLSTNKATSALVADINSDGYADLVIGDDNPNGTITLFKSNGIVGGVLQLLGATSYSAGSHTSSVAAADFNGDGLLDLVASNNVSSGAVIVLPNNFGNGGIGTFPSSSSFTVGANPVSVAVGDVNADGKPDIVTANSIGNSVSVLLNNANGSISFTAKPDVSVGSTPSSVKLADMNGDGKLDLVVANTGSNTVSIALGNGDGTFASPSSIAVGTAPADLAVADFNGDGLPDFAIVGKSSTYVTVVLASADGYLSPATYTISSGNTLTAQGLTVGDFNGDGIVDVATTNVPTTTATVSVLAGTGTGALGSPTSNNIGSLLGLNAVPNLASITAADLDHSGNLALVLPLRSSNPLLTNEAAILRQVAPRPKAPR